MTLQETMAGQTIDKRALMVYGHEIWLELFQADEKAVEIALAYGDCMRADGFIDPRSVSPVAFDPDGCRIELEIVPRNEHHFLTLAAGKPGYYISAVDLQPVTVSISQSEGASVGPRRMYKDTIYAGNYQQMAKIIVPFGEAGQYRGQHVYGIFDMVPDAAWLVPGSTIGLTLLYEGRPVSGIEICAIAKTDGKTWATGKTGTDGTASLRIPRAGTWMFIARHRDRQKRREYEYDETVFVTTLVMETARIG
jgi:uncharacterized GH25 family protein